MEKKKYHTMEDAIQEWENISFSSEEEFKSFMQPQNHDISIDSIQESTIEGVMSNYTLV